MFLLTGEHRKRINNDNLKNITCSARRQQQRQQRKRPPYLAWSRWKSPWRPQPPHPLLKEKRPRQTRTLLPPTPPPQRVRRHRLLPEKLRRQRTKPQLQRPPKRKRHLQKRQQHLQPSNKQNRTCYMLLIKRGLKSGNLGVWKI